MDPPRRLPLALLPTPLERCDRLGRAWGGPTIWVKRDDLNGFELSGNKVRKLEFHFAAARRAGADTVITCGAEQSNHCRATALAAARLGFACVLLLRTEDGSPPPRATGNHLLHRLSGADLRFITPGEYAIRDDLMRDAAAGLGARGRKAWVIPEGASDALGMLGLVAAAEELRAQLDAADLAPAAIWHAASSAGTTAGLAWGADRHGIGAEVVGSSVGDPAEEIADHVRAIWDEAAAAWGGPTPRSPWRVVDDYVGGGYGVASVAELAVQVEATRSTGMLFDPTYSGKALFGLRREIEAGRFTTADHVVFWHTGGGFALFAHDLGV